MKNEYQEFTGKASLIILTVTAEGNSLNPTLKFSYSNNQTGDVIVKQPESISYKLNDLSGMGLKFVGAGFVTPFDGVIEAVTVSQDGQYIQLMDFDRDEQTTKMQFVLSNNKNSLLVLSPDPQIINHPDV